MVASAVTAAILPTSKPAAEDVFSLSHQSNDGSQSTESCMRTVAATDDPCEDDSQSIGFFDLSGSTSAPVWDSDGATTL